MHPPHLLRHLVAVAPDVPTLNFGLIDLCDREFELLALALAQLHAICMLDVYFHHGKDNECGARRHIRSPKHTLVRQIARE